MKGLLCCGVEYDYYTAMSRPIHYDSDYIHAVLIGNMDSASGIIVSNKYAFVLVALLEGMELAMAAVPDLTLSQACAILLKLYTKWL